MGKMLALMVLGTSIALTGATAFADDHGGGGDQPRGRPTSVVFTSGQYSGGIADFVGSARPYVVLRGGVNNPYADLHGTDKK